MHWKKQRPSEMAEGRSVPHLSHQSVCKSKKRRIRIRIIIIIRKNYNKAGEINQGLLCIELITKVTKGGRGAVKIPHENIYIHMEFIKESSI